MKYYQHNIGDHLAIAAHITVIEDGVLRRAIDYCLAKECALPEDFDDVMRVLRVTHGVTDADLCVTLSNAVRNVLNEFFVLRDDGYRCDAIDKVLGDYHEKAPSIDHKKSNNAERQAKNRERKKELSSLILSKFGQKVSDRLTVTQLEKILADLEAKNTDGVTRDADDLRNVNNALPNHKPITINHEPLTNNQEDLKSLKALGDFSEKTTFGELGYDDLPQPWSESVLEDWPELHPDDLQAKWVKFRDHSLTHTFAITEPEWLGEFAKWLATDAPKLIEQRKNPPKAKPEPEKKILGVPVSRIAAEAQPGESEHDCAARLNRKDQAPKTTKPHTPRVSMEWSRLECSMLSKLQEHDPELTRDQVVSMAKTEGVQPVIVLQRLTTAAAKESV